MNDSSGGEGRWTLQLGQKLMDICGGYAAIFAFQRCFTSDHIQQDEREGEIIIHKAALFSGDRGLLTHHFILNQKAGRLHPLKT